jgi:hypothetical protein
VRIYDALNLVLLDLSRVGKFSGVFIKGALLSDAHWHPRTKTVMKPTHSME